MSRKITTTQASDRGSTVRGFAVEDYDFIGEMQRREEDRRKLVAFVTQSNRIENITRPPTEAEIKAHEDLLKRKRLNVEHIVAFVAVCQPNAVLRATRVARHRRQTPHLSADSWGQTPSRRGAVLSARSSAANKMHSLNCSPGLT